MFKMTSFRKQARCSICYIMRLAQWQMPLCQIRKQAEALEDKKNKVTSIVDGLAAIAEENAASTEETSASMLEFNEILSVCNKATGELRKLSEELAENTKHFDL